MLEHERIREETSCGCRYDVTGLYVFLCAIHDGLNARQSGAATWREALEMAVNQGADLASPGVTALLEETR